MRTPTALFTVACAAGSTLAYPSKRYTPDPNLNVTGQELAYTVPPVMSNGGKAWSGAHSKARDVIAQMTLDEKIGMITGQAGPCAGQNKAVERLGIPALCLQDGPSGVRPSQGGTTQFPAGVTTAATWDRDLIHARSLAMGREFYNSGVNVALTPVTGGPLGANPSGGRNWEGWYADPYATGVASYLSVVGMQEAGVIATSKHWLGYEQDTSRNPYTNDSLPGFSGVPSSSHQLPISSNIDDKTTHELYAWSFAEAVRAGTGSVMCAYNRVNGTHACSNSVIQNGLLKGELNFQGSIMSDWGGVWATEESIVGGLDWEMPGLNFGGALGTFFDGRAENLFQNGTVGTDRLDDMIARILTPYYFLGQDTTPLPVTAVKPWGPTESALAPYRLVQEASTVDLVKKIAEDGTVLLKNENNTLPLQAPARIAIIGSKAGPLPQGFENCANTGVPCETPSMGGGSGWSLPLNYMDPLAAIRERAAKDRTYVDAVLNDTDYAGIAVAAANADVAMVFVHAWAAEGVDREPSITLNYTSLVGEPHLYAGEALVNAVAAVNPNTVVVLYIPGPTIVDSWIDHPNITAVISPLIPGEQSGPALASVIYGDISPSGKLPFTVAKNVNDYPPNTQINTTDINPQSNFAEGVNIDYRWFDLKNITPRYEFGYGMSYSTFKYNNIVKSEQYKADDKAIQTTNEKFLGQKDGESLYDELLTVSVDVQNTGDIVACEVAQLYAQYPAGFEQPIKQLRGFDKAKQLAKGQSKTLTFPIRRKDVAIWDVVQQIWRIPAGEFTFHVGSSSRTLPLSVKHTFA